MCTCVLRFVLLFNWTAFLSSHIPTSLWYLLIQHPHLHAAVTFCKTLDERHLCSQFVEVNQWITTLNLLCICLWIHNLRSAASLIFVLKQDKYIVQNYVVELFFFSISEGGKRKRLLTSWLYMTFLIRLKLMNLFQVNLKLKDQRALPFRNLSGTLLSEALISLLLWLTLKLSTVLYDKCTVQRCRVDVPSLIKHICCSCREVAHELWRWACVTLNFLFPWCSTLILYCDVNEGGNNTTCY